MSDFLKAIRFESPSAIPVSVSLLPAVWIHHGPEAERLVRSFPQFFPNGCTVDYSDPQNIAQGTYKQGSRALLTCGSAGPR